MEIIEQIGSYAGLAAIVGLAVLSALYFSQARDVRRLRETEEGRAAGAAEQPEPAKHAGPKRPTAAPVPAQAAGGAEQATPAGSEAAKGPPPSPAPAEVAASQGDANGKEGAKPPPASKPAPAGAAAAAGGTAAASSGATAPAAASPGATAAPPSDAPGSQEAAPEAPPAPAGAGAAGGNRPPPRPAPPRLPSSRPGATAAALRSTSPPGTPVASRPWYRRLAPRYIALIVAGVVVVGAGAAYAVTELVDDGDTASTATAGSEPGEESPPLDPSTITVAVLNGTDVPGLAAQVADTVEAAGFQRGNVANSTEQASAESAVLYASGARSAARQVGQELSIGQIEPIDDQSQALAGTADVVVVVGADQAE